MPAIALEPGQVDVKRSPTYLGIHTVCSLQLVLSEKHCMKNMESRSLRGVKAASALEYMFHSNPLEFLPSSY